MGRPEKLSKEQQAEAIADLKAHGGRSVVCAKFGISELTLRRYERNAEFVAGQKAERVMEAQEAAQEMRPPEAA